MKKYNIVFLDFDGVLNGIQLRDWKRNRYSLDKKLNGLLSKHIPNYNEEWEHFDIDIFLDKINILSEALKDIPDIKIVLSTSWRRMKEPYEFHKVFNTIPGWEFEIIGRTGRDPHNQRGKEIASWIELNKNIVGNYVIIDDETVDMLPSQSKKIVKTDVDFGIRYRDVFSIKKCLLKIDIDGKVIKNGTIIKRRK